MGYFTSWDKSREKGCIYCGKPATTREHIPSKAFLIEPYPEDLATLPACFECNNGFQMMKNMYLVFWMSLKRPFTKIIRNDLI